MAAHAVAHHTIERLGQAGWTDVRVLKGCATGHLDYARPTDRYSSDVDLLVSTVDPALLAQVFPAEAIPAPRRRRWQKRYGKATTIVGEHGVELDLHVTIGDGYFGLVIPPDELRQHAEAFDIAGTRMLALDGPGRLLHAAMHIGYGHYNLNSDTRCAATHPGLGGGLARGDQPGDEMERRESRWPRVFAEPSTNSSWNRTRSSSGPNATGRQDVSASRSAFSAIANAAISSPASPRCPSTGGPATSGRCCSHPGSTSTNQPRVRCPHETPPE